MPMTGFNSAIAETPTPEPTSVPSANSVSNNSGGGGMSGFFSAVGKTPSSITPSINTPSQPATPQPKQNFLNTVLAGVFPGTSDVIKSYGKDLWNTYEQTPSKIVDDIKAGASNMALGTAQGGLKGLNNFTKGALQTGFRTAADAAGAIFAPISSALSAVLGNTGGQKLTDQFGQVVADKSGITDWPAFQKFAMSHPNASEDFNRLLVLAMSKGEKGEIDPKRILDETKKTAQNLVDRATKGPPPPPKSISVKSETPGETKVSTDTSGSRYSKYAKEQGYEPYKIPQGEIQIGPDGKPKTGEPSVSIDSKPNVFGPKPEYDPYKQGADIQIDPNILEKQAIQIGSKTGHLVPDEYTYEPIKESVAQSLEKAKNPSTEKTPEEQSVEASAAKVPKSSEEVPQVKETVSTSKSRDNAANKPVESTGPTVPSGSVSVDMITKNLDAKKQSEFEGETSHQKLDTKEQATKAWSFIHDNPEHTENIIFNGERPPSGLDEQAIFTARLQKALDDYNAGKGSIEEVLKYQKADELLGTRRGQGLQLRANRYDGDHPSSWLAKAKENLKASGIKYAKEKSATIKQVRDTISKTAKKLVDAQELIDRITCKQYG